MKYKLKYLSSRNARPDKDRDHYITIKDPVGLNFGDWIEEKLRQYRIPFEMIDTDSNFYEFFIGDDQDSIKINWKRFDESIVNQFNKKISKYGYYINLNLTNGNYAVQFVRYGY